MKILSVMLALYSFSALSGTSMNLEGKCTGALKNSRPVSFTYYSNFNGCNSKSTAALTYTSGMEGLLTGTRLLKNSKDVYTFPGATVSFKDSTGNTSGTFKYFDGRTTTTIEVQCEVRDYEYSEC